MANDNVATCAAALRDVENTPASAEQDCSDVIHISVFFDGTGNNKDLDEPTKKWSNVARIWRAAQQMVKPGSPNYTVYVSGVGTPFNGKPLFAGDEKQIALRTAR